MVEETVVKTKKFKLNITNGDPSQLKQARRKSRKIYNKTIKLKKQGLSKTRIQQEIQIKDYLANNKCAVISKALQTWKAYQKQLQKWRQNNNQKGKPQPPKHNKKGHYPLIMAHKEGYKLTVNNEQINFRLSPKPYTKIKGTIEGKTSDLKLLRKALSENNYNLGQAELLYREGVYYLHVPIKKHQQKPNKENTQTLIGVDINEDNTSLTALDKKTLDTKGTLVISHKQIKQKRQKHHTIRKRCKENNKHSIHDKIQNKEQKYVEWILHNISKTIIHFTNQFEKPCIILENLKGMKENTDYGSYMNRRLHKLPYNKLQEMITYKAKWEKIPVIKIKPENTSKTCSACGKPGVRKSKRFNCNNKNCNLIQDHADRNASVNIALKEKSKIFKSRDYHTHKTQPSVRLVSLCGSGRPVNRPTSSLARQGVLA